MLTLGKLERVDIRNVWTKEHEDFTPWLADNLHFIGEIIGSELELEAQEKAIGNFRADIVAKDINTEGLVLIENQLERTDHCHLGQLLTYASGLKAATIVWIACQFTDEHIATLDWLNSITEDGIRFFGLQIEAWSIGDSIAPKFNIMSRPNTWIKKGKNYKKIMLSGSDFDKRNFVRQCLSEDPAMSIGAIQRRAQELGETISVGTINTVRKAFFGEQKEG